MFVDRDLAGDERKIQRRDCCCVLPTVVGIRFHAGPGFITFPVEVASPSQYGLDVSSVRALDIVERL